MAELQILPEVSRGPVLADAAWRARAQALAYRWRNGLAGAPLAYALVSTRGMSESSGWPWAGALGLAAVAIGLRAWATRHNRYAQRSRKTLATTGPYASTRNPLYIGNALLVAAGTLASGLLWLLPFALGWAFAVYAQVVRHEERRLLAKYGPAYASYRARVPRWLPRVARGGSPRPGVELPRTLLVQSRGLLVLAPFLLKAWGVFGLWAAR